MNAYPYRGIAPRQTAAQRARRALVASIGHDAVAQQDADRIDYYRALLAQARSQKPL